MWKFTKLQKVGPTDTRQNEGIGIKFIAEFQNGTAIESMGTVVEGREQMEATLRSIEKRLDKRDADLAAIDIATYTLPAEPVEEVAPAPTPEQVKEAEIVQAEQELVQEVERAKREKEVAELAQSDVTVAEKLAALEALRAKK